MAGFFGTSLDISGIAIVQSAPTADTHVVRKVDLDAAIAGVTANHDAVTIAAGNGASVALTLNTQELDATLTLKTTGFSAGEGEIGAGASGHFVKLGTGANVAAAGDHVHAVATGSVDGFLSAAGKTKLDALPTSFLALGSSGTTAAAGNHTHAAATVSVPGFLSAADKVKLDALPTSYFTLTSFLAAFRSTDSAVHNSNGSTMGIDVRLKTTSLTAGVEGSLSVGATGITVDLGATSTTAAPGNHTHSDATVSVSGFLSAADKTKLDAVPTSFLVLGASGTTAAAGNHTHSNATVSVAGFLSTTDKSKLDALPTSFLALGSSGTTAAAGNHTHSDATVSVSGFLSAADKVKLDALPTSYLVLGATGSTAAAGNHTHSDATVSVAGFLSAAGKTKLDGIATSALGETGIKALLQNSDSWEWDTATGGVISGDVHLKTVGQLGANEGLITVGANGLAASLGTTATTAAAGNHAHSDATVSVSGFMSAADKTKLDGMATGGFALSTHTHAAATVSVDGFLSATDKVVLNSTDNAQVDLTLSATVSTNCENKVHGSYYLAITGGTNPLMGAPSNMKNGGFYTWNIVRDGSQTMTWNAVFNWGVLSAPSFGADNAIVVCGSYAQGVLRVWKVWN